MARLPWVHLKCYVDPAHMDSPHSYFRYCELYILWLRIQAKPSSVSFLFTPIPSTVPGIPAHIARRHKRLDDTKLHGALPFTPAPRSCAHPRSRIACPSFGSSSHLLFDLHSLLWACSGSLSLTPTAPHLTPHFSLSFQTLAHIVTSTPLINNN